MLAKLKELISMDPASVALGVAAGYLLRTPIKCMIDIIHALLKL